MKLSRTVTYAVAATMQLAREHSGRPVPCSRLAAKGGMPERFLLQILRNLVRRGVLQSTRGVEGGYALARPPEDISVLEIVEAVEGPLEMNHEARGVEETGDSEKTETESRELRKAIAYITEKLKHQMEVIKLCHLLSPPK